MPKKQIRITVLSAVLFAVFLPAILFLSIRFLDSSDYYFSAAIIVIAAIIPFFFFFENRKIKTSELVTVALTVALAVSARAVTAFLPQVKPTCAVIIVAAAAFGANAGFVTGCVSMLISNLFFGQGMFTPFQMLGMGLVGFFCGLIFCGRKISQNRFAVSLIGGIMTFFVYGIAVDTCSVLMLAANLSFKSAVGIYLAGVPFNLIHAATTALLLFFIGKPAADKFARLRVKYGIFKKELFL